MSAILSAMRCSARLRFVVALISLVQVTGCSGDPDDPEAEVRAFVSAGVEAVASESRRDLMAMVSTAYADPRGNGREDIGNILRLYFLRTDSVTLLTHIDELRFVGEDVAEVDLTVGGAGASSNALGFSADAYNFSLELQKDGDDWMLISARWGEIGGQLH